VAPTDFYIFQKFLGHKWMATDVEVKEEVKDWLKEQVADFNNRRS
jgi:hypothetical protein